MDWHFELQWLKIEQVLFEKQKYLPIPELSTILARYFKDQTQLIKFDECFSLEDLATAVEGDGLPKNTSCFFITVSYYEK